MRIEKSRCWRRKLASSAAACAFAVASMTAYCDTASAQQARVSPKPVHARTTIAHIADLERTFWACDYVATTRGVDATPADLCSAAFDAFKDVRFGGDFEELLNWWRGNKVAEHQKLAIGAEQAAGD